MIGKNSSKLAIKILAGMVLISGAAVQILKNCYSADIMKYEWMKYIFMSFWAMGITVVLSGLYAKEIHTRNEWIILMSAWLCRVIYILLLSSEMLDFTLVQDDVGMVRLAKEYFVGDYSNHYTYMPYIINAEWQILGPYEHVSALISEALTMTGSLYLLKILDLLEIRGKVRTIAWMVVLFSPLTILYGSVMAREALYFVLVIASFYHFLCWIYKCSGKNLVLSFLITIPINVLHIGYIGIPISYSIVVFFHSRGKLINNVYKKIGMLFLFALTAIILVYTKGFGHMFIGANIGETIEQLMRKQSIYYGAQSGAGSFYLEWMEPPNSLWEFLIFSPVRMICLLICPLIWDVRNIADAAVLISDSLIFIFALIYMMKAWKVSEQYKMKRKDKKTYMTLKSILLILVTFMFVFGWGTFTSGTAMRHRNCMLPIVVIFIALVYSISHCRDHKKLRSFEEIL